MAVELIQAPLNDYSDRPLVLADQLEGLIKERGAEDYRHAWAEVELVLYRVEWVTIIKALREVGNGQPQT